MRVVKYHLLLDHSAHPELVKENAKNYSAQDTFCNADIVVKMFKELYQVDRWAEEYTYLLALNTALHPLGVFELSHGSVNSASATPREIFIRLLLCGASGFIFLHNHPSGDVTPSSYDIDTTKQIGQAAAIMNVAFFDHIIIGQESYFSFKQHGQMPEM